MTAAEAPWVGLAVLTLVAVLLAAEALRESARRRRERNRYLAEVYAHNATKARLEQERRDHDAVAVDLLAAQDELERLQLANVWLRREARARFAGVMADWLALDVKGDCPDVERLDGAP